MANGPLDRLVNVPFIKVIEVSFVCLVALTLFRTPTQNTGQTHKKRSDHPACLGVEMFRPCEGCRHPLSEIAQTPVIGVLPMA
jgi:hypothetical protein